MLLSAFQLAATLTLVHGELTTPVRNNALAPVHITIEVRERRLVGERIEVGAEIPAIVAPRAFTLQPGETQVLRVRTRQTLPAGSTIALVATFVPLEPAQMTVGAGVVARITMVTRVVGKVTVE